MSKSVRIIGIDPGLRRCGWGIVDALDNRLTFVAAGTVTPPIDGMLADRLAMLAAGLAEVLAQHRPEEAAVEETFAAPRISRSHVRRSAAPCDAVVARACEPAYARLRRGGA